MNNLTAMDLETALGVAIQLTDMKLRNKKFVGMEAEDVKQDVMEKVCRNYSKYDETKSKFKTWVEKIIDNVITDCYRKSFTKKYMNITFHVQLTDEIDRNASEEEVRNQYVSSSIEDGFSNFEIKFDLFMSLGLNSMEKKVLLLKSMGYESKEIAELLNYTPQRINQIFAGVVKKYKAL